jgi:hypothetical protein
MSLAPNPPVVEGLRPPDEVPSNVDRPTRRS